MVLGALMVEILKRSPDYEQLANFRFIKNDRINDWIGVNLIKWIVAKTAWRRLNPKLTASPSSNLTELKELRMSMTHAEVAHLFAFILQIVIIAILWWFDRDPVFLLILTLMNVFLNLYPSLLQQRNKVKLDRVITVLERRKAA